MHTIGGPSLQLVLALVDGLAQVGVHALYAAWERWIGPQRFHRKLAQLARAGLIERVPGNLARVVRITDAGRLAAVGGRDPEACWRRPWDGRWRVVLFDVPEIEKQRREKLRATLRAHGFGCLQNSAWINPDPVDALLGATVNAKIDAGTLSVLEARPCAGESDTDIVLGAWDFARINRRYELYSELLMGRPTRVASLNTWRRWLDAEWRSWLVTIQHDPLLPQPLLPSPYRGREVWLRRKEILHRVLTPF